MDENKNPIPNQIPIINVPYQNEGLKNKSNLGKLIVSIVLIIVSLTVVGYITYKFVLPKLQKVPVVLINDPTEFIVTDNKVKIDVADKLPEELLNEVKKFLNTEPISDNVNEIIFTKTITGVDGEVTNKINLRSILLVLGIKFPDDLIRSLSDDYVLGYFTKDFKNNTFIIFKTANFDSTYNSMLSFESDLVFEMRKLFGGFSEYDQYREVQDQKIGKFGEQTSQLIISSSTATSSLDASSTAELANLENEISILDQKLKSFENFQNRALYNTDSRVIVDANNNVLFYYTYIDKEWLLFAQNEEVLKEIKRRITEKKLTR